MGSDSHYGIPIIDLSVVSPSLIRGTERWKCVSKLVQEACQEYGCFEVVHKNVTIQLRDETFCLMRPLFELPQEIKNKNFNPKPYHGYAGNYPVAPLYESFGIEDASNHESLKNFADLMWPHHDHPQFCQQTFGSMMKSVEELNETIEMLIRDSYGVEEKEETRIKCKTLLRVMRYKSPPLGEASNGLNAHTDKLFSTLLCEDQVSALEVESKYGQWIKLVPSPQSFVYIVGDGLMAWSNGRLHAVKHRVVMSGHKDRYSFGAFQVPTEGTIIKPPKVLVDEEHPQFLKEFDFMEFLKFSFSEKGRAIPSDQQLFAFVAST